VCRGADDLDASVVSAVVGLGSLKGWQEAVVDVDGVPPVALTEAFTEDLHVPAQADAQQTCVSRVANLEVESAC